MVLLSLVLYFPILELDHELSSLSSGVTILKLFQHGTFSMVLTCTSNFFIVITVSHTCSNCMLYCKSPNNDFPLFFLNLTAWWEGPNARAIKSIEIIESGSPPRLSLSGIKYILRNSFLNDSRVALCSNSHVRSNFGSFSLFIGCPCLSSFKFTSFGY